MKIVNERIRGPAAPSRRPGRRPEAGGASEFAAMIETTAGDDIRAASPARATSPAAAVLTVQQLGDAQAARSRNLRRGRDILDQLDSLRLALIGGAIPRARLGALLALVESERAAADPRLAALLDEIELRARVELAKYVRFG